MFDVMNIVAVITYSALFFISVFNAYLFYISNRFKPNFMIKATMYVLIAISLCVAGILFLRISVLAGLLLLHNYRDFVLIPLRIILLLSLVNFLKNTIKLK